jgi:hypothetical protein
MSQAPLARLALLAALAAAPARADPASVQVTISPQLQRQAEQSLGVKDIQDLAVELQHKVIKSVAETHVLEGARVELVLVDAKPNHPTMQQMSRTPGLSPTSFGLGGATIEGRAIAIDGAVTPLRYRWYETDLRLAQADTTWADASIAIQQFATRLSRGETYLDR